MTKALNVEDYRQLAKRRLPRQVFDYLEGGAEDETGIAHNHAALDKIRLAPYRLVNVEKRDLSTNLFGRQSRMPVAIAPTGFNEIFWPKADIILAQAAANAGIPFLLSTASNKSIEEVARYADGDRWFQLYVVQRELARDLARRAKDNGYSSLVLTVDVTVNGNRERDVRNKFRLPMRYTPRTILEGVTHPRWSLQRVRNGVPQLANFLTDKATSLEARAALMTRQMDATFDWAALRELRDTWTGTLIVKGLLRAEDVKRCEELGVDGVVLSNHGGRQLDCAVSPVEVLEASRNSSRLPLLVDSGFRRGEQVVKAICMGASSVLLGRAILYGLAAQGRVGVDELLAVIRTEIDRTLALVGCPAVDALSSDLIFRSPNSRFVC